MLSLKHESNVAPLLSALFSFRCRFNMCSVLQTNWEKSGGSMQQEWKERSKRVTEVAAELMLKGCWKECWKTGVGMRIVTFETGIMHCVCLNDGWYQTKSLKFYLNVVQRKVHTWISFGRTIFLKPTTTYTPSTDNLSIAKTSATKCVQTTAL
jgi:hypothetical protein